jgi:hypothetical protein
MGWQVNCMVVRISLSSLSFFVAAIVFRAMLDISYVFFVNPIYEYLGFFLELTWSSYFFSWILFFLAMVFTSHRLNKLSDFFFVLALLALIAPLTSLYGLSGRNVFPVLITITSIGIIYILTRRGLGRIPVFPVFVQGGQVATLLSILMIVYLVSWYFYSGAVLFFNLDFSRVYEFRTASADLANVGVLAYLNNWVYKVFSLFLFSWFLFKKKLILAALVFGIQVFFYGVSAHKSLLFYPFLIFVLWYCFRRTNRLMVLPVIFVMVVVFTLLLYFVFDQIMPASMFIRRVFYVPALLTYDYFSFFSENRHIFWSNSILSGFLNYPYEMGMAHVVGKGTGANNGFISSGYAHAGFFGVLTYSVILALILRVIDVVGSYLPVWFALALTAVPLYSALISSDLFTVILTHGLLISLLLLVLIRPSVQRK